MNLLSMLEEKLSKEKEHNIDPTSCERMDKFDEGYNQALKELKSILSKIEVDEEEIIELIWKEGFSKFRYIKELKTIKPHNVSKEELKKLAHKIATQNILKEVEK